MFRLGESFDRWDASPAAGDASAHLAHGTPIAATATGPASPAAHQRTRRFRPAAGREPRPGGRANRLPACESLDQVDVRMVCRLPRASTGGTHPRPRATHRRTLPTARRSPPRPQARHRRRIPDPARHVLQLVESLDRWDASTAAGLKDAATATGPASPAAHQRTRRFRPTAGREPRPGGRADGLPAAESLDRWDASTATGPASGPADRPDPRPGIGSSPDAARHVLPLVESVQT